MSAKDKSPSDSHHFIFLLFSPTYPMRFRTPSPLMVFIDFRLLFLLLGSKRVRDWLPNIHENQRAFMIHENQNYVEINISSLNIMVCNTWKANCFLELTIRKKIQCPFLGIKNFRHLNQFDNWNYIKRIIQSNTIWVLFYIFTLQLRLSAST